MIGRFPSSWLCSTRLISGCSASMFEEQTRAYKELFVAELLGSNGCVCKHQCFALLYCALLCFSLLCFALLCFASLRSSCVTCYASHGTLPHVTCSLLQGDNVSHVTVCFALFLHCFAMLVGKESCHVLRFAKHWSPQTQGGLEGPFRGLEEPSRGRFPEEPAGATG